MARIHTSVIEQVGGAEHRAALAATVRTDERFIDRLVDTVTPVLLAGLGAKAVECDGAGVLSRMVDKAERLGPTDRVVLDDFDVVGVGLLHSLYGPAWHELAPRLARSAGVTPGVVARALAWLLPVILAEIGRRRAAGHLRPEGLALLVRGELDNLRRDGVVVAEDPSCPGAMVGTGLPQG